MFTLMGLLAVAVLLSLPVIVFGGLAGGVVVVCYIVKVKRSRPSLADRLAMYHI